MEEFDAGITQSSEPAPAIDVSNDAVLKELDELQSNGQLDPEKADLCRKKFLEMHAWVMRAMAAEKSALQEAKSLNQRLQAERSHLDRTSGVTSQATSLVDVLREDAEHAESEVAMAKEREQMYRLEVAELERQKDEAQQQLEELEREHAALLAPQIRQMKKDILELQEAIEADKPNLVKYKGEIDAARERYEEVMDAIRAREAAELAEKNMLAKIEGVPEKIRKQSDVIYNQIRNAKITEQRLLDKIHEVEVEADSQTKKVKQQTEEYGRQAAALEKLRVQTEQKERSADDIRKDLEEAGLEADQLLGDQVNLDIKMKAAVATAKHESDQLQRRIKERDTMLRKYKRAEQALEQLQATVPPLENMKANAENLLRSVTADNKKLAVQLEELRKDVDIHMSVYLKKEAAGKDMNLDFQRTYLEVTTLEKEVREMAHSEKERNALITDLASQRERSSRQAAKKIQQYHTVLEHMRVKELIILDLKKKKKDTWAQLKDFSQLYDLVKNQRNKFVNLIQAAAQSTAEMEEKLKIVASEMDILRLDVAHKDKLLAKARSEHGASVVERDHMRTELNAFGQQFREKQTTIDEQIAEVDKLNGIINAAEKEMLRTRKEYEMLVEARNMTGITLIDRNDELCILYEKANVQEEVLKNGEMELAKREDEIRLIKLEIAEVQREIEVTRRLRPEVPKIDEEIVRLQQQLHDERQRADELSTLLEDPANRARWRRLEGRIPDKEELEAKVLQLEERLNDKKEQLLEKELILEEITSLSDRLRRQAAAGRTETIGLASNVNDYQTKLRETSRRMMATVSELSMYQATAMKLAQERQEMEGVVVAARERVAQGLPPTEDSEHEWYRMERERVMAEEMRATRVAEKAEADAIEAGKVVTTAETRPNAYISEELGIPRPYGMFKPVKPTETGATMRHIRKPVVREIQI
eukprot:jgi/Mesvir1/17611/Mv08838-RA.1